MADLPLRPHFRHYRGGKEALRRKTAEFNSIAQRIANYANTKIADDPNEVQILLFGSIALDMGLSVDQVWEALSDGGSNGITVRVTTEDRRALESFRTVKNDD